jgi:predicted P-loop ATPase
MIKRDRAQLWAEGGVRFREQGVCFQRAEALAVLEHDKYTIRDTWEPAIGRWVQHGDSMAVAPIDRKEGITIADVLTGALGIGLDKADRGKEMRVAKVLKVMGFERRRITIEGDRPWRYVFGDDLC